MFGVCPGLLRPSPSDCCTVSHSFAVTSKTQEGLENERTAIDPSSKTPQERDVAR